MSVVTLQPDYEDHIEIRDKEENFNGNRLVYIHWEEHLMFCAALAFPFPPDMPFGGIVEQVLPEYYGIHPDFKSIKWDEVKWTIDGNEVTPDMAKSIDDNGVKHKSLIRFWTPGLNGYKGTRS